RLAYVAVSIEYRLEANSTGTTVVPAMPDALDDQRAAIHWLKQHASTYRIDTRAIIAGGYSAGAVTSLNQAYTPDATKGEKSPIAAAVSIAGVLTLGHPEAGEPPEIEFHGADDPTNAHTLDTGTCPAA